LDIGPGEVRGYDAAIRLDKAMAGPGIVFGACPSERNIALEASHRWLLKVNVETLTNVCRIPTRYFGLRPNRKLVQRGETISAAEAIPLMIDEGF
jgi:hypothetical protein